MVGTIKQFNEGPDCEFECPNIFGKRGDIKGVTAGLGDGVGTSRIGERHVGGSRRMAGGWSKADDAADASITGTLKYIIPKLIYYSLEILVV